MVNRCLGLVFAINTMLRQLLLLLMLLITCSFNSLSVAVAAETFESLEDRPKVLFIYPAEKGFPFWDSQVDFAQALCDVLGFELEVVYSPRQYRNRFAADIFIKDIVEDNENKPALVISSFWVGSEELVLDFLEEQKIHAITINSDITPKQFNKLGYPRENYPHWLAHLSPNDTLAGQQLAEAVLHESRLQKCPQLNCQVNIFGITGLRYSAVSEQRAKGLREAIKKDAKSKLLNLVYGKWDGDVVKDMTETILHRHKDLDAFWVASDIMAYGIYEKLKELDITLPENTVVGSMDWSPASVNLIKEGKMAVNLGGHFMEAGWAILLYYDYLNNKDFLDETGPVIKTQMSILNKGNVEQIGRFLANPIWSKKILKGYSKYLNPARETYNLNPREIIFDQLNVQDEASEIDSTR